MANIDPPHELLVPAFDSYRDYVRRKGSSAVKLARGRAPEDIVLALEQSGLRGRGGAGFPTGTKWRAILSHPCPTRYVVCNAAEGEPGTFKDRYLLRRDPYSMLEGLLIAAHVASAQAAYVAIKGSFTREVDRLRRAVAEMSAARVVDDVPVHVIEGPEEYLFGEEKALLEVVEGNDPLPREPHYPPYEKGLFATATSPNPAIVNNVETLARVPDIVRLGPASFREDGSSDTPGRVLFTLSGAVQRPGVYELPAGVPLREVLEAAGGLREGRVLRAILCGVSCAAIGPDRLDTPADHAHLQLIGSGLGSAGFVVIDDHDSLLRVAQSVARFLYVESCDQCAACKLGLGTASEAIDELFGEAAPHDAAERAFHGARHAPQGNRCYLPVQGSILIPDLLRRSSGGLESDLAANVDPGEPYLIPKMIDFDEATHTFTYDERQPRKRPDWTYEEPPSAPAKAAVPAEPARPAEPPPAEVVVAQSSHGEAPVHSSFDRKTAARPRSPAGTVAARAGAQRNNHGWQTPSRSR